MSALTVYRDDQPGSPLEHTTDRSRIAQLLAVEGIRFEQWQANQEIARDASQEQILAAYQSSVDKLMAEEGFQTVDVIHMKPDHPQKLAFRHKFIDEHRHSEDEVRFFVAGQGLFCLHLQDKVFAALCRQGDLISVPAGTPHWFDMGTQPEFTAIRFFNNPEGWVAHFTENDIASRFPRMAFTPKAILTDIEGTTGSISFVHEVLFPYAKENLPQFVRAQGEKAEIRRILDGLKADQGLADEEAAIDLLLTWIAEDRKATPLKELQGLIWEAGYRNGDFKGHVYPDALQSMQQWQAMGKQLFVYSSGSVKAQKLLFGHADQGDLVPLFSGFFDTHSGPKKEQASYETIAREIGCHPGEVLFLSDVVAELDAARAAGMSTALLARDQLPQDTNQHDSFTTFTDIPVA